MLFTGIKSQQTTKLSLSHMFSSRICSFIYGMPLVLLLLISFVKVSYARSYAVYVKDLTTGKVLKQVNPNAINYPASITKVMTLYLLFDALDRKELSIDSNLYVSKFSTLAEPSKLYVGAYSRITVKDAIYALITKSANDVARVVGENLAGSEYAFADLMNKKAKALGMYNTHFTNASGFTNKLHYTTPKDIATLGEAMYKHHRQYYHLFSTKYYVYKGMYLKNHNNLMSHYHGMDGMKTGYTRKSGFTLLAMATRYHHRVLISIFGGRSGASRDRQTSILFNQAFHKIYYSQHKHSSKKKYVHNRTSIRKTAHKSKAITRLARRDTGTYFVQLGYFSHKNMANKLLDQIKRFHMALPLDNYQLHISISKTHTVFIPRIKGLSRTKAESICAQIKNRNHDCFVTSSH